MMRLIRVTRFSFNVCVCLLHGWKRSESVAHPSLDFLDMSLASHPLLLASSSQLYSPIRVSANCMREEK